MVAPQLNGEVAQLVWFRAMVPPDPTPCLPKSSSGLPVGLEYPITYGTPSTYMLYVIHWLPEEPDVQFLKYSRGRAFYQPKLVSDISLFFHVLLLFMCSFIFVLLFMCSAIYFCHLFLPFILPFISGIYSGISDIFQGGAILPAETWLFVHSGLLPPSF